MNSQTAWAPRLFTVTSVLELVGYHTWWYYAEAQEQHCNHLVQGPKKSCNSLVDGWKNQVTLSINGWKLIANVFQNDFGTGKTKRRCYARWATTREEDQSQDREPLNNNSLRSTSTVSPRGQIHGWVCWNKLSN
jgi:hypothetical protein